MMQQAERKINPPGARSGMYDHGLDVLVLDDSEFDLVRMTRMLNRVHDNIHVVRSKTLDEFAAALDEREFDLCIIDYSLGDGATGNDALKLVKEHECGAFTPALLVSGSMDDAVLSQALENGFLSHLNKSGLSVERLKAAMRDAIETVATTQTSEDERFELLERLMDGVAATYSSSTKAHLTKIFEHSEFMRRCLNARKLPSLETVDQLEASCFAIWRFLDEAENHGVEAYRRRN